MFGISLVLNNIFATALISASNNRMALSLSTRMEFTFFCSITDKPLAQRERMDRFLMDRLINARMMKDMSGSLDVIFICPKCLPEMDDDVDSLLRYQ